MNKSQILKNLILDRETLIMPNAYDPISAMMIEKAGFKAVQCSGYSFSIQAGYSKESDVSLEENLDWTRRIVEAVDVPVMADAEDGYGDAETIIKIVEKFLEIGVAGINIEDQILGEPGPLRIIDEELMAEKIMVARKTAEIEGVPDLVINGRTDALRSTKDREDGLNLAIERANTYLDSGATLAFITYIATMEEALTIAQEVKGPVTIAAGMPYNLHNFTIADLKKMKVARVSLPTLLIYSGMKAMEKSLDCVKNDVMGEMVDKGDLFSVDDVNNLLN